MKLPPVVGKTFRILVGLLLVPAAIGAMQGFLAELERSGAGARPFMLGLAGYLFFHLVIYKASWLYGASHACLSRVSAVLFGGKVAVGENAESAAPSKKSRKADKPDTKTGRRSSDGGSTLVALSPLLVPTYALLAAAGVGLAGWWWDVGRWQAWSLGAISALLTFHWLMTLELIQEEQENIASAGYTLTVVLVYVISLTLTAAALPLAVRDFSMPTFLSSSCEAAKTLYVAIIRQLFW